MLRGNQEELAPAPTQFPRHTPELPPDFTPSYQVHISPSTSQNASSASAAADHWISRGADLKTLTTHAYQVEPGRVDFPQSLDTHRYDIAVILPRPERDTIRLLLQQAIQNEFHLTVTHEGAPRTSTCSPRRMASRSRWKRCCRCARAEAVVVVVVAA